MTKYKITIEELNEYDETRTIWKDPKSKNFPLEFKDSKYSFPEEVRDQLTSHQELTGRKLVDSKKVYEQTLEDFSVSDLVYYINKPSK